MIGLYWPLVIATTIVLYSLIIITLPFNQQTSTLFLFALISYWSRLPGVGIPSPFFILYLADVVDLFSMLIAIHVGGIQGAFFSLFGNMWSRAAGITPWWNGVIKDSIIMFCICLITPFLYAISGKDVFVTMMLFTIIRRIGFIILWFFYPVPASIFEFAVLWSGVTVASLLINGFYARYFGYFFDSLLANGVSFNWPLFIAATVIVFGSMKLMMGKNAAKILDQTYLFKILFKRKKKSGIKLIESVSDEKMITEAKNIINRCN
jgi:hypothetical protein